MTKASDNAFPSILITEGTEPSAPAAGKQRVYIDSTTHKLKRTDSSGTDVTIEGGSVATDTIFDAKGDLAVGTGADTAAKLTVGANGKVPVADSSQTTGIRWDYPPGYELDYVQKTSNTSITATSDSTADTIVTGASMSFDGTAIIIEFFTPFMANPTGNINIELELYEDGSRIGHLGQETGESVIQRVPVLVRRKHTPSAGTHQYSIRAFVDSGTGTINGGAGGAGAYMPCYMRITKA